jgi:hypothetical protein
MKIKDATGKANEALDSAAAQVERAKLTKWVLLALAGVLLVVIWMWFAKAQATGYEQEGRSPSSVSGAVSNSKAIAGATAGAVGAGGMGGAASSGGGSASVSEGNSNTYALGLSLTTSQGDCPVLGSFNVAFIGGTYPVKLCHALQAAKLMQAVGMSKESVRNMVCSVPEIAENASECRK